MSAIDYASAGVFTDLTGIEQRVLDPLPHDPVAVCRVIGSLIIHPFDAPDAGIPEERFADNQVRPARDLVASLLAMEDSPLTVARPPARRIVGTCRHFAVLGCAVLRYRGFAARARCGFATYFQPGRGLDHWVVEYRLGDGDPWVRMDVQMLGGRVSVQPEELEPGEFLTGGEAWIEYRLGNVDASTFGVGRSENWGPSEIRGNAVRDLASLNKVEMLPWDEWGRMTEAYEGKTGAEYDELLDDLAQVCAGDDMGQIQSLYEHGDLRVPENHIAYAGASSMSK